MEDKVQRNQEILRLGRARTWNKRGHPIIIKMPFEIVFFSALFRFKYIEVIDLSIELDYWLHDAIHGWLGAAPDYEGEVRVLIVEEDLGVKTVRDFQELIRRFSPEEIK